MLFIGTKELILEEPYDPAFPRFSVQAISGEFLPIKQNFENPNVYSFTTGRGCACDFGIRQNLAHVQPLAPIQKLVNVLRKVNGSLEEWNLKQQAKRERLICDQKEFLADTFKLVNIIEQETAKGDSVEMFCVWAGNYEQSPEIKENVEISDKGLQSDFEISENVFTIFNLKTS